MIFGCQIMGKLEMCRISGIHEPFESKTAKALETRKVEYLYWLN